MPRPPRTTARAKPHSRAKAAARDVAAMDPDVAWADDLYARMLADCHPFQRDAVEDPGKRVAYLVGRGGGKTTSARVRALRKITSIRGAKVAYVATSRPEAERLNWDPLKKLIDDLGERENFEFSESKMLCRCKRTGGTYQFFGADDKREIGKLRGQPFNEFQVDEAASHDPTILDWMLNRVVGPRLGERHGCILILGTPGHILYGLFYDVTRPGSDKHRPYSQRTDEAYAGWIGWSSHAWTAPAVLALPDAAEKWPAIALNWAEALVTKEREKYGDDNPLWLREYLGLWAADGTTTMYSYRAHNPDGTPFNQWSPVPKDHPWVAKFEWGEKIEEAQWAEALAAARSCLEVAAAALPFRDALFGYGMDLGGRDPYALNVAAWSPTDPERRVYHVFCFSKRRMYARLIADLLIGAAAADLAARHEPYEAAGLYEVTDWPPAAVADLAALGDTLIAELQNVYGIKAGAAEKRGKHGAIEVVNGDLTDGRMFIIAGSPLEVQLSTLQWKPDENGQPKEDRAARNDHADSWTYIRTDISTMLGGKAAPKDDKPGDGKKPKKPAPPPPAPWEVKRSGGEYDSLMADDDFSAIE
jgi:hypothetical protein